jgi:prevent-host-death family protein
VGVTTVSSRDLNQDVGRAKKAALQGPVVITDRGRPSHVLLSFAEYRRLLGDGPGLIAALAMPGLSDIAFDPPPSSVSLRSPDLG